MKCPACAANGQAWSLMPSTSAARIGEMFCVNCKGYFREKALKIAQEAVNVAVVRPGKAVEDDKPKFEPSEASDEIILHALGVQWTK